MPSPGQQPCASEVPRVLTEERSRVEKACIDDFNPQSSLRSGEVWWFDMFKREGQRLAGISQAGSAPNPALDWKKERRDEGCI